MKRVRRRVLIPERQKIVRRKGQFLEVHYSLPMKILRKLRISFKLATLIAIGLILALAATGFYTVTKIVKEMPEINKVSDYHPLGVTQIISVENKEPKVMAEFYKERRYLTPYDQIPQSLVHAFISAEDSQFFEHQGINFVAIARAALANFLAGQVVQGGSTITQQIAKSLYLSPDRNFIRKAKETVLAFQLEKALKKEEILYLYLNQIYLGSGSYGVQAAARQYFQKDLKKLSLGEMALIAGLPTAPGKFSPLLNPKRAKERQLYVLKRMMENKYITEKQRESAAAENIKIYVNDGTEKKMAPHLVEHIRRYLIEKYGEKALYEEGLTVVIPAAIRYYNFATEALENGLEEIDQRKGYRGPIKQIQKADWEKEKEELKTKIAKEIFPYRLLTEDGRLDLQSAIEQYDPTLEKSLSNRKIQGLVVSIADDQKSALVNIGLTNIQIPFDNLKWAFPAAKPGAPAGISKQPKTVLDVLALGDLVWIKNLQYSKTTAWKGTLTQIPEIEGAIYSVDITTGQILAMVGGYDFERSEFNRAVQAKRQVGSTFKPIIYSAALEHGYTPATVIVDSPIVFDDAENGRWKPENFEEKFYGDTLFRQALVESRNIPTIKIVQDIKVGTVIEQAKRLGLEGPFNHDLSISLGSANASLQDMVQVFTAFPMLGRPFRPILFDKILDRDGRVLETAKDSKTVSLEEKKDTADVTPPVQAQVTPNISYAPILPGYRLDPRVAYVMIHLMREVVQFGTAAKASALGRPVAGKTGTTQDYGDGWFMGFSPKVVTGVWVGYDDQRSMGRGETGANTALPIWIRYMQNVLKDYPIDQFEQPEGIVQALIDPKTGKRSTAKNAVSESFIAGTEPGAPQEVNPNSPPISEPDKDDEFLKEDN